MNGWEDILSEDEKILWQGRPDAKVSFQNVNVRSVLFGIAFFGFAVFWTVQAFSISKSFSDGVATFFPLFGVAFIAVSAYQMLGKHFWQAYLRRQTFYTLTDQRAFIAVDSPFGGKTIADYPIGPKTEVHWKGDSIFFARERRRSSKGHTYTVSHGFEFLRDQVPDLKKALKIALKTKSYDGL